MSAQYKINIDGRNSETKIVSRGDNLPYGWEWGINNGVFVPRREDDSGVGYIWAEPYQLTGLGNGETTVDGPGLLDWHKTAGAVTNTLPSGEQTVFKEGFMPAQPSFGLQTGPYGWQQDYVNLGNRALGLLDGDYSTMSAPAVSPWVQSNLNRDMANVQGDIVSGADDWVGIANDMASMGLNANQATSLVNDTGLLGDPVTAQDVLTYLENMGAGDLFGLSPQTEPEVVGPSVEPTINTVPLINTGHLIDRGYTPEIVSGATDWFAANPYDAAGDNTDYFSNVADTVGSLGWTPDQFVEVWNTYNPDTQFSVSDVTDYAAGHGLLGATGWKA